MSFRISVNEVEYSLGKEKSSVNLGSCFFTSGITYVVGLNGSGKSTLLKLISTAIKPKKGVIAYTRMIHDNHQGTFRKQLEDVEVRRVIGYLPQDFKGLSSMTIQRYLKYIAYHKGIPYLLVKPRVNDWLKNTNLYSIRNKKLGSLSGGQLQKVGLIQAIINDPRICILDEPFVGLDNEEKLFFLRKIERLSFNSIVLISTHLLEEIDQTQSENSLLYVEEGKISLHAGMDIIDKILERMTKNSFKRML